MDKPKQLISLHPISQPKTAPDNQAVRFSAAMTSRLISRPANLEISPRVTGCK